MFEDLSTFIAAVATHGIWSHGECLTPTIWKENDKNFISSRDKYATCCVGCAVQSTSLNAICAGLWEVLRGGRGKTVYVQGTFLF